jgi:hypothetical protein
MDKTIRTHLDNIWSEDGQLQNKAYSTLMDKTEKPVDWAYEAWDELVEGLTHKDNHVRAIAAQLLANLAKSDPKGRIFKDFDKLLNVTKDERFVTARHCLQSLWKIGLAGKKQQQLVVNGLEKRYHECISEKNALVQMIAAGEDPKFIVRRLIIAASEDVGNADPRALQVAVAAGQALDWIGLPEAQYALAQATIHVAVSPKSDSVGRAYGAAMADALKHGSLPVPNHLKTAGDRRMKAHGIGVGYRFPHEFEGDDVEQQYLPDELIGRHYYVPGDQGYEPTIAARMEARANDRAERPRKKQRPEPPMASMSDALRPREENRQKLAETQKKDAS